MTIFYIVCCLLCLALVLCNLYFADVKLTGKQTVITLVVAAIPFINAMFLLLTLFVMARMIADEAGKG